MSLLEVDALTIRYGDQAAVDGLSFSVGAGESVGLVGESGSGKTQTAMAALGLLPANASISGSITLAGSELLGAGQAHLNKLRARRIAVVFQDPMQALNPFVRVGPQIRRILTEHALADGAQARQQGRDHA